MISNTGKIITKANVKVTQDQIFRIIDRKVTNSINRCAKNFCFADMKNTNAQRVAMAKTASVSFVDI